MSPKFRLSSVSSQKGQTLTEFVVVALFILLPLALLIPLLAQLLALRQDTETAARYVVWERTSWLLGGDEDTHRSDATVARHAERRVYSAGGIPVVTRSSEGQVDIDPFYRNSHGRGGVQNSVIAPKGGDSESFLTVHSEESEPPGIAGAFSEMAKLY